MRSTIRIMMSMMVLAAGVVLLMAGTGCAKEPVVEITAVGEAMQKAESAEAEQYASPALANAKDARAQLDAELKAQSEKFSLFRSYERATELARAAAGAAQQAEIAAVEGKEMARDEAATALTNAGAAIERTKALLAQAPAGKGTQADLQAMSNDIGGMEQSLAAITAAYESQSYLEAKAKAVALEQSAARMEGELVTAMETWKSSSRKRRS